MHAQQLRLWLLLAAAVWDGVGSQQVQQKHWEMCVHDAAWLKVKLLPVSKVWPHVRAQTQ